MVTLEWTLERSDGVTLVGLVVAADRPCRVRVENRLDGPVWPPRRRGQPAAGWDDGAFTGRVPADGRLAVGYATPASPAEPPAAVVATEPATESGTASDGMQTAPAPDVESTPAGVVRALGDPAVPRDSVPVPETGRATTDGAPRAGATNGSTDEATGKPSRAEDRPPTDVPAPDGRGRPDVRPAAERLVVPGAVRAWLRDVEQRFDAECERPDARTDAESTDPVLAPAREADRRALQRVRRRVDALLARGEGGSGARTRSESVGGTDVCAGDGDR